MGRHCRIVFGRDHLLGYVDGLDHFGGDHGLLAGHQVLEKIYGHAVIWRQERPDVASEEVINLAFALVLGREFF